MLNQSARDVIFHETKIITLAKLKHITLKKNMINGFSGQFTRKYKTSKQRKLSIHIQSVQLQERIKDSYH